MSSEDGGELLEAEASLGSRYRLRRLIGTGAMGQVWEADDLQGGAEVAAKILRSELASDPELVGRFIQERSILLQLDHPSVVRVHDLVVEGDRLAMVMDLIDGSDLRAKLKNCGTLPPYEAARLMGEVLDALDAAHRLGILHRDVKPENVLLDTAGTREAAKLTDFSIARLAQETTVKMTGLLGTAAYIAPEVFTSEEASPAVDVYGAGITLYELLAGRTPFQGQGNDYAVAHRHVSSAPPNIPGLQPELWSLVERMLSKDPSVRPSAAEASSLLREIGPRLQGSAPLPVQATPDSWVQVAGDVGEFNVRGTPTVRPGELTANETAVKGRGRLQRDSKMAGPLAAGSAEPLVAPEVVEGGGTIIAGQQRRDRQIEGQAQAATLDVGDVPEPKAVNKTLLGAAGAATVVLIIVIAVLMSGGTRPKTADQAAQVTTQLDDTTHYPSGLSITGTAMAQGATTQISYRFIGPHGPYVQVFPGLTGSQCSALHGDESITNSSGCPVVIGSQDATETIPKKFSSQSQLSNYLNAVLQATSTFLASKLTCTTAAQFPAQEVQSWSGSANSSGSGVEVRILPAWLSTGCLEPDGQNPIFDSSTAPNSSQLLVEQIGGSSTDPNFSYQATGGAACGNSQPSPDGSGNWSFPLPDAASLGGQCNLKVTIGSWPPQVVPIS